MGLIRNDNDKGDYINSFYKDNFLSSNNIDSLYTGDVADSKFVVTNYIDKTISSMHAFAYHNGYNFFMERKNFSGEREHVINFINLHYSNILPRGLDFYVFNKDNYGYFYIDFNPSGFTLSIMGVNNYVNEIIDHFTLNFKKPESYINWIYSDRGESLKLPLIRKPMLKSAYPFFKGDTSNFISNYLKSDSNILVLLGPPGTGKTSFIRELIHQSEQSATLTYDERVMHQDGFFAGFMDDSNVNILVMEDADTFIRCRTEGNNLMHKFLNISDGLISSKSKKMIFSTNLNSVDDIDSALIRPGRCFDVVQFRELTRDESLNVLSEIGREDSLPKDKEKFTLAEVLSKQDNVDTVIKSKMGF